PIVDDGGLPQLNRDFLLLLTNATLDATESPEVQQPRLDPTFSQALVRILDIDTDPKGPAQTRVVTTNIDFVNQVTNTFTNIVWNLQPTNAVFSFMKSHYRFTRDADAYWGGTKLTVFVDRWGTNTAAAPNGPATSLHWAVDTYPLDNVNVL